MAFIFNGEEDWSGDDCEPIEALETGLQHVEFDTVDDLYALARALRVNVDQIRMGSLPEGKAGCTHIYSDGSIDITMACYSVLVAVHEFAHVCRRKEREDHGEPFKRRMARLIRLAEDWLEDKIEVIEVEEETYEPYVYTPKPLGDWWTPKTVTTVEPIAEDTLPLWALLDQMKEGEA